MNETTREMLENSNSEMFGALTQANAIIGQQADEAKRMQDTIDQLKTALTGAVTAGEYVVQLCEADMKSGESTYPNERSMPAATLAHCYAAMSFLGVARKALAGVGGLDAFDEVSDLKWALQAARDESDRRLRAALSFRDVVRKEVDTIYHSVHKLRDDGPMGDAMWARVIQVENDIFELLHGALEQP